MVCIWQPDRGALLACALPPPPPPPPHRPPPPQPLPLPPFYRSSKNTTADTADTADAADTASGPVDAYEQLSKGFRPPVDKKTAGKRARRSEPAAAGAGPSAPVPAAAASSGRGESSAPGQMAGKGGSSTDPAESARAAAPAQTDDSVESAGRSAFVMPHSIIGAFHSAPPPLAAAGPDPLPLPTADQPATVSTRHHDAYVLVGVASAVVDGCSGGQMIFDDVIQEAEFIQQVLHRGG